MKTKIFLTSILAISFAMPVMAEITNNATCDTTNLGQSDNNSTANVEAIWTANQYDVRFRCNDTVAFPSCAENNGSGGSGMQIGMGNMNCQKATFNESFTFSRISNCMTPEGYTSAGWSCVDTNNNTTTYNRGQTIAIWNIDSGLDCTAQWTANTINIDWNPKNGDTHTTNTCTYGETITLPTEPTKTGYSFNGWVLSNPCDDLDSQSTCNANAQCFWYGTASKCANINPNINGCYGAADQTACNELGYCRWSAKGNCGFRNSTVCNAMTNSEDCGTHDGCSWDNSTQTCQDDAMAV